MSVFPIPPAGSIVNCELRTVVPSLMTIVENDAEKDYAIIECEGKGMGLFTKKTFQEGDFVINQEHGIRIKDDERVNEHALRHRLTSKQIDTLMKLENHNTGSLITVLDTNAFQLPSDDDDDESLYWSVFPTVSRINHSCSPNCVALISSTGIVDIKVVTRIPKNTEVTISYNRIDHGLSPSFRVKNLLQTKKFTCNCELCFRKRRTDSPKQENIINYCLENLSESGCEKTVEELIGTVHAAAKLLKGGYKHWAVAYSLRTLMLNAIAAVAHYDLQNKEWNAMLLLLLSFFIKWSKYHSEHNDEYGVLPDLMPQWLVTLIFDSVMLLVQVDISQADIHTTLYDALNLIDVPHKLYYGDTHTDSVLIATTMAREKLKIPQESNQRKFFNSEVNMLAYTVLNPESILLQDYIENEEPLANKIVAPTSAFTRDFLKLGLDDSSFAAVDRHAVRMLKEFNSM
eukprot:TRINITY_DN8736_c1_g1_i1.p1 TRINITY_DN8736_c1_g1~~TRINITY_DN8736_c1_g1_i1.p1  ORF type:complete len:458 (+),score=55.84 TRINITY_DN8736_c1_g1_i1:41-1414(+)